MTLEHFCLSCVCLKPCRKCIDTKRTQAWAQVLWTRAQISFHALWRVRYSKVLPWRRGLCWTAALSRVLALNPVSPAESIHAYILAMGTDADAALVPMLGVIFWSRCHQRMKLDAMANHRTCVGMESVRFHCSVYPRQKMTPDGVAYALHSCCPSTCFLGT